MMLEKSMIRKKMESLPEELLLDTFHFLDLPYMSRVRRINRCCHRVSKSYTFPSEYRVRGPLRNWRTSFPKLTTLNIQNRIRMPPEELFWARDVTSLNLSSCEEKLPTNIFATFSNLKVLDIQYCSKSWRNFDEMLSHVTGLTELRVSDNHYVTDAGIGQLVHLQKLYIHNCSLVTDKGLAPLTQLTELDLYNMYNLTDDLFKSFVHLTDLKMTFGGISTAGICHLKKLKKLFVMGCSRVSDCQGLQDLPLEKIHFSSCCIPDENMRYLSHVPVLSFYGVTYLGGSHFSQLTKTHTLSLFKLHLEEDMVESIAKMPNLKKTYMYDCYVSSEIKQQLRTVLPNLHSN